MQAKMIQKDSYCNVPSLWHNLTIRIIWIVFRSRKMNEYEYRIPLFGPNYSNIWALLQKCTEGGQPLALKCTLGCLPWVLKCTEGYLTRKPGRIHLDLFMWPMQGNLEWGSNSFREVRKERKKKFAWAGNLLNILLFAHCKHAKCPHYQLTSWI